MSASSSVASSRVAVLCETCRASAISSSKKATLRFQFLVCLMGCELRLRQCLIYGLAEYM